MLELHFLLLLLSSCVAVSLSGHHFRRPISVTTLHELSTQFLFWTVLSFKPKLFVKCFTCKSVLRLSKKKLHYLMQWWIHFWQLLTFWGTCSLCVCQSVLISDSRGALECNQTHCSNWDGRCISISRNGQQASTDRNPTVSTGGLLSPYISVWWPTGVCCQVCGRPPVRCWSLFSLGPSCSLWLAVRGREFLAKGKESWLKVSFCSRDTTAVWIPYCSLWHPFLFPLQ